METAYKQKGEQAQKGGIFFMRTNACRHSCTDLRKNFNDLCFVKKHATNRSEEEQAGEGGVGRESASESSDATIPRNSRLRAPSNHARFAG